MSICPLTLDGATVSRTCICSTVLGARNQRSQLAPPFLTKTALRGSEQPYSMKLALTQIGPVQWELVQPLERPSIYEEFLVEKG